MENIILERNGIRYSGFIIQIQESEMFFKNNPDYKPLSVIEEGKLFVSNEVDKHTTLGVTVHCPTCGSLHYHKVIPFDYFHMKWESKDLQQAKNCFPYLSMKERESFLTGLCDNCLNVVFTLLYDLQ